MSNSVIFIIGLFVAILASVGIFTNKSDLEQEKLSGTDPRNMAK